MVGIPPLSIGRALQTKRVKLPRALSLGEETFAFQMKVRGLKPVREFRFCPDRAFRADFAFPEQKLLIEVEGGTRSNGRHNRAMGFSVDCIKYNLAAQLGYRVLRYTTEMVARGAADLQVAQILGLV